MAEIMKLSCKLCVFLVLLMQQEGFARNLNTFPDVPRLAPDRNYDLYEPENGSPKRFYLHVLNNKVPRKLKNDNVIYINNTNYPQKTQVKKYLDLTKKKVIVIPIMLHFDRSLTEKLKNEWGETEYIEESRIGSLSLIKQVENNLKGLSKDLTIKLLVAGVKFMKNLKNKTETSDASEYLKKYCNWQAIRKKIHNRWFHSVLITGLNLYYVNPKGRKVMECAARTFTNGICSLSKSCTILEGDDESLVQTFTHELGHSLGIRHDGRPWNTCLKGSIMSSTFIKRKRKIIKWSRCSKEAFSNFYEKPTASCLHAHGYQQSLLKWNNLYHIPF